MEDAHIISLIVKFLNRRISADEKHLLDDWTNESDANKQIFTELIKPKNLKERVGYWPKAGGDKEKAWETIQRNLQQPERIPIRRIGIVRRYWGAAAAVLIIVVGIAIYFQLLNKTVKDTNPRNPTINPIAKIDVPPGGNKAILTLSDGKIITLDSTAKGILTKEGQMDVIKSEGLISYQGKATATEKILYNTLTVPKGGQYRLLLNDGTKVWVNSASSIRYPAVFAMGKERKVEITGEAYFEVATAPAPSNFPGGEGKKIPFIVETSKGIKVEVLGTHFNISAYDDEEAIATTLLEGKVRVSQPSGSYTSSKILNTGEQALVEQGKGMRLVKNADIESVMAWRDGKFRFRNTDIASIMRQISRWYDVEIVYEGKVPPIRLNGKASRNLTLTNLLGMLQLTDVKFRIENKKLIIPEQ